jgi:hypothetical protein
MLKSNQLLKKYPGYVLTIAFYLLVNIWILYKWISFDYDNNYAGATASLFLGFSNLILNIGFFISFLIAALINKDRRILYLYTACAGFIPILILIITGL